MIIRVYHTLRERESIALRRYLSPNGDCDDAAVRAWIHQLIDDEVAHMVRAGVGRTPALWDANPNTEQPQSNAQEATKP